MSAGVKFKDAELLGMPTIVVVGRGLVDGMVEIRDRRTGERHDVPLAGALAHLLLPSQQHVTSVAAHPGD